MTTISAMAEWEVLVVAMEVATHIGGYQAGPGSVTMICLPYMNSGVGEHTRGDACIVERGLHLPIISSVCVHYAHYLS